VTGEQPGTSGLPPDPESYSDAAWFHDLVLRLKAARDAGDAAEQARLRDYARREGGEHTAQLVDQVLAAADDAVAMRAGRRQPSPIGANLPGQRLCDFCSSPHTVAYYPFEEFALAGPGGEYLSGDRMYVCVRCHHLVETGDWKGLRDWVGPAAKAYANRLLWIGFRNNRTGPAVFFPPGSDPEAERGI
jgi:hypothetical protein